MAIAGNVDATLAYQWVEDSFGQWHSKPVTDQEAASGAVVMNIFTPIQVKRISASLTERFPMATLIISE